jgi:hypothetical protein
MKSLLLFVCLLTPQISLAAEPNPTPDVLRAVAQTFRDPDGVRFRLPYYVHSLDPTTRNLCVYANGKNAFGGYAGEQLMLFQLILSRTGAVFSVIPYNIDDSVYDVCIREHDSISRGGSRR